MTEKMEESSKNGVSKETSDLYQIKLDSPNPFNLFKEWLHEAEEAGVIMPTIMHLATSDGCGRVSGRALLLRQLDPDGFIMMTDNRSKKSFDLLKCPRAALTFVWMMPCAPSGHMARQVRIEGVVKQESFQTYKHLYTSEPLYCKIRSTICRQGEFVEWSELKESHDRLYAKCLNSKNMTIDEPPPHYIVYKMYPEMMEFYAAKNNTIGDRVVFRLDGDDKLIPSRARTAKENGTSGTFNEAPVGTNESSDEGTKLDKELCTTFSNGLHIDVGFKKQEEKKQPNQNWIHYHIAA